MNNEQVLKAFLDKQEGVTPLRNIQNGYYTYKGRTLTSIVNEATNEFALINYKTIIAYFIGNALYLNNSKYSCTTSKIQTQLRNLAREYAYDIVEYVDE